MIDLGPIVAGEQPHPDVVAAALRQIVRRLPAGGNRLEAAITEAITLGWRARHELQQIREERR